MSLKNFKPAAGRLLREAERYNKSPDTTDKREYAQGYLAGLREMYRLTLMHFSPAYKRDHGRVSPKLLVLLAIVCLVLGLLVPVFRDLLEGMYAIYG